jgi:PhzF family phenazine biosynthesis protein
VSLRSLSFALVDVFASEPLSGNGLSIFLLEEGLTTDAMQRITQEMRQFETIFVSRIDSTSTFGARIFTMEEELSFAGHPIIGAAAFLHSHLYDRSETAHLAFVMPERTVDVTSRREGAHYFAEMDQGVAGFDAPILDSRIDTALEALNLTRSDLDPNLPLQVVSTGLPYLIVPVTANLESARIVAPRFEVILAALGAKFVYVLDVERREGRTWDNDGRVEDIATGSAAGPAAAYLVEHGRARPGESLILAQGRFVGRPSELHAVVHGTSRLGVTVRGQVCLVGNGALQLPEAVLRRA